MEPRHGVVFTTQLPQRESPIGNHPVFHVDSQICQQNFTRAKCSTSQRVSFSFSFRHLPWTCWKVVHEARLTVVWVGDSTSLMIGMRVLSETMHFMHLLQEKLVHSGCLVLQSQTRLNQFRSSIVPEGGCKVVVNQIICSFRPLPGGLVHFACVRSPFVALEVAACPAAWSQFPEGSLTTWKQTTCLIGPWPFNARHKAAFTRHAACFCCQLSKSLQQAMRTC